jgi:hypothetical protein
LDVQPESTYLAGGRFTASDMLAFWAEAVVWAEGDGYSFCRHIVKTHPQVLIQGILVENPYHLGPDEFLSSAVT